MQNIFLNNFLHASSASKGMKLMIQLYVHD